MIIRSFKITYVMRIFLSTLYYHLSGIDFFQQTDLQPGSFDFLAMLKGLPDFVPAVKIMPYS